MSDVKLADLNEIQDFFNRSHSTSASGTFSTEQIGIKDFIKWCNLCEAQSKYSSGDRDAKALGKAVDFLDQLNNSELKAMESALKENRWTEWLKDSDKKVLAEDAVFYLELKRRTDNQHHYHFSFDRDAVAEIDAFDPFTKEGGKQVLNQQWHVLISLLAFLDVAHALSNDQHKYHCLYPYLSSYDKGDLNKMQLKLKSSLSLEVTPEIDKVTNYTSEPMMTWIKDALVKQEAK